MIAETSPSSMKGSPAKNTAPAKELASPQTSASQLETMKKLKEQAYALIDAAISVETSSTGNLKRDESYTQARIAKEMYSRGAAKIQQISAMPLPKDEPYKEDARDLKRKVMPTLDRVKERMELLREVKPPLAPSGTVIQHPAASAAPRRAPVPQPSRKAAALMQPPSADAMADSIIDQIIPPSQLKVSWSSIAGLQAAKQSLTESVIMPLRRPDIFTGLRTPVRGILLFGPPGTGKTMLAKAVASEAGSTFISVSAATITSKFVGESEKMVRSLFEVARKCQPSIVFIDEIDGLLCRRGEASEHEASRRLKTEFLLQCDGINSRTDERMLLLGATNRPNDLDEAVLRRFTKRIYVPLPDLESRRSILAHLLGRHAKFTDADLTSFAQAMTGYSASDVTAVVKDAALGPVRELGEHIFTMDASKIRDISARDIQQAIARIKPSVDPATVRQCESWDDRLGAV